MKVQIGQKQFSIRWVFCNPPKNFRVGKKTDEALIRTDLFAKQPLTECEIILNKSQYFGVAALHPKDVFSADVGRKVALKHALEKLPKRARVTKKTRKAIWDKYFSEKSS